MEGIGFASVTWPTRDRHVAGVRERDDTVQWRGRLHAHLQPDNADGRRVDAQRHVHVLRPAQREEQSLQGSVEPRVMVTSLERPRHAKVTPARSPVCSVAVKYRSLSR